MNVSNINNALLSEYRNLQPHYNAPNIKTWKNAIQSIQHRGNMMRISGFDKLVPYLAQTNIVPVVSV